MDIMQAGLSYDLGYHEKVYRYDTITMLRISYNLGYQHIIHITLRPYPLMNPSHPYILYHRNITKALGILWTCSHPSKDFSHPTATSSTRTWGKQETTIIGICFHLKNCRYASSLSALYGGATSTFALMAFVSLFPQYGNDDIGFWNRRPCGTKC